MSQLCLYIDDATLSELRRDAARENLSLSKYVVSVLKQRNVHPGWPKGFFDLYGVLRDDDTFVEPPDIPFELDAPRLAF